MKVRDIIKNAERITLAHNYTDGTYLFDIGIADKTYVIRTTMENITALSGVKVITAQ